MKINRNSMVVKVVAVFVALLFLCGLCGLCSSVLTAAGFVHIPTPTPHPQVNTPAPTPYQVVTEAPTITPTPTSTPTPAPLPTPVVSLEPLPFSSEMNVYFINVGQGDSELITINGKSMLIDGGIPSEGSTVASFLSQHGVSTIDVLVLTHPHNDHVGGLPSVMQSFPVKQVIDSGQIHTISAYGDYLGIIDSKKIPYKDVSAGYTVDFDPHVTVQVLSPPSSKISASDDTLNENSVVIKITYNNVRFLFAGDAESNAESRMISAGYDLKADVLKVGHHGSKYSSTSSFISRVSPVVSIIEVGSNSYGHPAPSTIQTLQNAGSKVYTTLDNGNIAVTTDGNTYSVQADYGNPLGSTSGTTSGTPIITITPTQTSSSGYQGAVIGNKNSNIYHNPVHPCGSYGRMLESNKISFSSRTEAEANGYRACLSCRWT